MSVIDQISEWASSLPYWEQATLDLLMRGRPLGPSHYNAILQLLLEDEGLVPKRAPRPTVTFARDLGRDTAKGRPTLLLSLSNLENVNALAEKQTLRFGPSLTAVYGGNGSGKSGYARVLGCAGFTRGDREVLADVSLPRDDAIVLSAHIEIAEGDTQRTLHYRIGERCLELSRFYVFDSTSVHVHLCESNPLSFSPVGLSYLTALADATDEVGALLQQMIDDSSRPHTFDGVFVGDSEVTAHAASLAATTDLSPLRTLASMTLSERQDIERLDLEIARLKTLDLPKEMDAVRQAIIDLRQLGARLDAAEQAFSEATADKLHAIMGEISRHRKAAALLGIEHFTHPALTQVGTTQWYTFAQSARALAKVEQAQGAPYPKDDSVCLLCNQPFGDEARAHLRKLWQFIEAEAQSALKNSEADLAAQISRLSLIQSDFLAEDTAAFRYLKGRDTPLLERASSFLTGAKSRRDEILGLPTDPMTQISSIAPNPSPELLPLIEQLETDLKRLETDQTANKLLMLGEQKRLLEHRAILSDHMEEIEDYVAGAQWAARAGAAGVTTAHITRFHNKLFTDILTEYIQLFEGLLHRMARPLKVKVVTRGRKGEVFKQIAVEAHPSAALDAAKPEKVLSEGEKRAVALADFLTEVALDTTSSGIILDDPVTSLDMEWRELIASILAQEATHRQVIVFTHDLSFLYFLKREAEANSTPIATHWIKRGDGDGRPGYVFLDNSPALEREYRNADRGRRLYAAAKDAPVEEQESVLREGFAALRTSYEAFIVFDLFAGVVLRFGERISFGRLKDVVVDSGLTDEIIETCERLSSLMEGHSHSDAMQAAKPTPSTLFEEIERFEALKGRHKKLLPHKA